MRAFRLSPLYVLLLCPLFLSFSACESDGNVHSHHVDPHPYYGGYYGNAWYYDDDDYPYYVAAPPDSGGEDKPERPERPVGDRPHPEHPIANVPDRDRPSTRPSGERNKRSMSGSRSRPSIPSRSRPSRGGGGRRR